jgi:Ca-activated chloride channel family protein
MRARTAVLFSVIVLAAAAATPGARQRQSFRAGVELIRLNVTVTDATRRYVSTLGRDDFVVTENGVPQTLTFFARTNIPLALALLIDSSASMEQSLHTAQEAAVGFVRRLGPADMATVIDFDSRVQIAHEFTSDQDELERAIRSTQAGGSTSLYNAVYIALRELSRRFPFEDADALRRRAMVVLSDGEDTSSLVTFEEVLDAAARSDTVLYTIGLADRGSGGTGPGKDGEFVLRRLTQQTGGRAFFPTDVKDLAMIYSDIRDELASQYALAYESGSGTSDGKWRSIAVRVNRSDVSVRTRQGYYAQKK